MNRKAKAVSEEQLKEVVRKQFAILHESTNLVQFSAHDVGERSYDSLDPKSTAPVMIQASAYYKLSELADEIRKKKKRFIPEQPTLFDGLWKWYTVKRCKENVEVLRKELTLEERRHVSRLLHAHAKYAKKHADAFDQETKELIDAGHFRQSESA